VVVIETDDQDAASLRYMPNVQRLLVARGTTFTNSFVSDSLCCPSRATFLTGQYAHNHDVLSNSPPLGGVKRLRASNTLAVWLRAAGYTTALVGKYLNGYGGGPGPGLIPPGWSRFQALLEPSSRYTGFSMNDNGVRRAPPGYQTDVLATESASFIGRAARGNRPFFLWLTPSAPHDPAIPALRDKGAYPGIAGPHPPSFDERDVADKPTFIRGLPPLGAARRVTVDAHYRRRLKTLAAVDRAVARVVQALASAGQLKQTVIVFTSDNGWMSGEHRLGYGKRVDYEESIRVPLVIRGPGFPRGAVRTAPVANIDLAPTISSLAGARPRLHVDGCSLLPLAAKPGAHWVRDLLFENFDTRDVGSERDPVAKLPRYSGIRSGSYMYTRYANGESELYDLRTDPYELRNRASDPSLAKVRAGLAHRLARLRTGPAPPCRPG